MFAILGQATASKENEKYPEGEIHSAMLFVSSDTRKAAAKLAVSALEQGGWFDVRLRRIGAIDPESIDSPDPVIQASFASAVSDGAAMIVYQDVDDQYAS